MKDKTIFKFFLLIFAFVVFYSLEINAASSQYSSIKLSDLDLTCMSQGWGSPGKNTSVAGNKLSIANKSYEHGIGTHSASYYEINLFGSGKQFEAFVGVDSESGNLGSVEFVIKLDGKHAWTSGIMKGGQPAKKVQLALDGKKRMTLIVSSVEDDRYDHADWADAVITYVGKKPAAYQEEYSFPAPKELPGGPSNAPAEIVIDENNKSIKIKYDHTPLLVAEFDNSAIISSSSKGDNAIEQQINISFDKDSNFEAVVYGSCEALAVETLGKAQKKFPLVRTSHGLSNNLRNNAIYDRNLDWMLEAPEGTVITSSRNSDGTTIFRLTCSSRKITLTFRPRYYQKHKNLPYFQPWTYRVRKDSITGWCTWWAYMRSCRQENVDELIHAWQDKNLADYGYRFIQLDDVYQGGVDAERQIPVNAMRNYIGGRPETWLEWKRELFPGGMTGYYNSVDRAGFEPGLWMGCFFTDKEIADSHSDWFVLGSDGKPFVGKWVTYVVDSTNPEAADALIRPTFRGLRNAGFKYLKIDQLRHMLYDNLNLNLNYMIQSGKRPDDIFRAYLSIAREELGDDCFILSCWGVLPESIGLADACRIGGDGYGPVTMQQYNSWNGIVWRNDPDHCDVSPQKAGQGIGNVTETKAVQALENDSIIRPALASIAGCVLMLSDKPEIYLDDLNLRGVRRSSPVLFSVPGQLYDFDPVKTDNIKKIDRSNVKGGTSVSGIDADQFGQVCPFWLNEFNKPFENWYVLHRLNWTDNAAQSAKPVSVDFADLGLAANKEYLVYEFWSDIFLGVCRTSVDLAGLKPMGIESIAIRENTGHPQLISTNRHLSQGAVDIEQLQWSDLNLRGRSRVVCGDRYVISIYIPDGYQFNSALINNELAEYEIIDENILKISFFPKETASVAWEISFF